MYCCFSGQSLTPVSLALAYGPAVPSLGTDPRGLETCPRGTVHECSQQPTSEEPRGNNDPRDHQVPRMGELDVVQPPMGRSAFKTDEG